MKIITLIFSILVAGIVTYILWGLDKPQTLTPILKDKLIISNKTEQFSLPITISPTYFRSLGKVYAALSSPYIESLKQFKVEMSLDNFSWLEIPVYSSLPDKNELYKFKEIGYINLNQMRSTIYGKSFIPPQQLIIPNISKETVLNSFEGYIVIKPIITRKDLIILIILFLSLLSTLYGILNSMLSKFFPN